MKRTIVMAALALTACERRPAGGASASSSPTPSAAPSASSSVAASAPSASTPPMARPTGFAMSFDADPLGGPAPDVEAVIGDWLIGEKDGARGLVVDGSRWRSGTPSVSLADQAKSLYGERYAEFLDGVRAFAFFPLAIAKLEPEGDVRLSVRFYPFGGKVDQAAGIAFGVQPDGSYWGARANALEDNLLYFKVARGKRTVIDTVRDVPTPTRAWHTLSVTLRATSVDVEVDRKPRLHKAEAAPRGRVGLWSKADSQVLFDDFKMERVP